MMGIDEKAKGKAIMQAEDIQRDEGGNFLDIFLERYLSLTRQPANNDKLREAAQAVIDRWDSPSWKDLPATADYIHRLRKALAETGTTHIQNRYTIEPIEDATLVETDMGEPLRPVSVETSGVKGVLAPSPANEPPADVVETQNVGKMSACPKCGLEAKSMLHPFCQNKECPVREHFSAMSLTPKQVDETELHKLGKESLRGLMCLYAQCPDEVVKDVHRRVAAYTDALLQTIAALRTAPKAEGCAVSHSENDNKKSCVSESAKNEGQADIGELAIHHGLMDSPTAFAHRNKIETALKTISDDGKCDAGIGLGGFDFWIKLQGMEYIINAKPSQPPEASDE